MISDAELATIEEINELGDAGYQTDVIESLIGEVRRLRTALAGLMNAYPISEEHTGFYDDCDACQAVLVGLDVLGVKEQIAQIGEGTD